MVASFNLPQGLVLTRLSYLWNIYKLFLSLVTFGKKTEKYEDILRSLEKFGENWWNFVNFMKIFIILLNCPFFI